MVSKSRIPHHKPLLRALGGEAVIPPPLWLMRQAGRYLPEYRALRARSGSFLDLCLTPELAIEITLQPIRRFALDAAILFSDILVVPHGLGQKVWFEEGHGPRLERLEGRAELARLGTDGFHQTLAPVYQTVSGLTRVLPAETALIGFAGAPWTVASYMIEGGGSKDFAAAKAWAYGDPQGFQELIDLLVDATVEYLGKQVEAGVEALQIFESWAGVLPERALERWSIEPCRRIIERVKRAHGEVPIMLFPRGAGVLYEAFAGRCGADALSLDTTVPLSWACAHLPGEVALQGNLDPVLLLTGGPAMRDAAGEILTALSERPFVFNLGYGVLPGTPPEHVVDLVEFVRGWRPDNG